MTELPRGWAWTTVGEVGHVMLGRQRSPKYHSGDNMRPYLRVKNVFEDRIDVTDVMEMDFSPEEFERYKLEPGDILLNEGQSPELIGRPAMYRGEMPGACFTNSLIRFRAGNAVDPLFALYLFRHYLRTGRFQREARITTNIAHLSAGRFSSIEVALAPLAEQRRIVAVIEEHLSRLDAAVAGLRAASSGIDALTRRIRDEITHLDGEIVPTRDLADVQGGIQKQPSRRPVKNRFPFLRVANVRRGELDLSEVHEIELFAGELERLALQPGDLLVVD